MEAAKKKINLLQITWRFKRILHIFPDQVSENYLLVITQFTFVDNLITCHCRHNTFSPTFFTFTHCIITVSVQYCFHHSFFDTFLLDFFLHLSLYFWSKSHLKGTNQNATNGALHFFLFNSNQFVCNWIRQKNVFDFFSLFAAVVRPRERSQWCCVVNGVTAMTDGVR